MEMDDIGAVGAYGMPLRFNVAEGMMAITIMGAPYSFDNYKARTRSVYVNKNLIGMYRGVGMPLACIATELLTDLAADKLGIDTVEFKRRTYRPKASLPCVTPGGQRLETVSFHECLEKLVATDRLRRAAQGAARAAQARRLSRHRHRDVLRADRLWAALLRPLRRADLDPGRLHAATRAVGLGPLHHQPHRPGSGHADERRADRRRQRRRVDRPGQRCRRRQLDLALWRRRLGLARHGRSAAKRRCAPARMLKQNILALAGAITQTPADALDIVDGQVVNTRTGQPVISLADVGRIGYFRQDTLPRDYDVQLSVSASFVANDKMYYMANGVQASYVDVDCDTGFIRMLGQWAVDDCGRVINPLLVDEQVRGGIVQGIGAVLFEECVYSEDANLLNGTMADYLVPMADEMPDIVVAHVETPETSTKLGAKGIGEAGLIGAMGSVWVAVNDALKPLGAKVLHQPFTPERVLDALARARDAKKQRGD